MPIICQNPKSGVKMHENQFTADNCGCQKKKSTIKNLKNDIQNNQENNQDDEIYQQLYDYLDEQSRDGERLYCDELFYNNWSAKESQVLLELEDESEYYAIIYGPRWDSAFSLIEDACNTHGLTVYDLSQEDLDNFISNYFEYDTYDYFHDICSHAPAELMRYKMPYIEQDDDGFGDITFDNFQNYLFNIGIEDNEENREKMRNVYENSYTNKQLVLLFNADGEDIYDLRQTIYQGTNVSLKIKNPVIGLIDYINGAGDFDTFIGNVNFDIMEKDIYDHTIGFDKAINEYNIDSIFGVSSSVFNVTKEIETQYPEDLGGR